MVCLIVSLFLSLVGLHTDSVFRFSNCCCVSRISKPSPDYRRSERNHEYQLKCSAILRTRRILMEIEKEWKMFFLHGQRKASRKKVINASIIHHWGGKIPKKGVPELRTNIWHHSSNLALFTLRRLFFCVHKQWPIYSPSFKRFQRKFWFLAWLFLMLRFMSALRRIFERGQNITLNL